MEPVPDDRISHPLRVSDDRIAARPRQRQDLERAAARLTRPPSAEARIRSHERFGASPRRDERIGQRVPAKSPEALGIEYEDRVVEVGESTHDGELHSFLITSPEGCLTGSLGDLHQLDQIMMDFMAEHGLPNGSLAVVSSDGRLVYAKSFTDYTVWASDAWAAHLDPDYPTMPSDFYSTWLGVVPSTPETQLRIASATKPITATAIMMLRELGVLSALSDAVTDYLPASAMVRIPASIAVTPDPTEPPSPFPPRRSLHDVTLADLLQHAPGWCERSGACATSAFPAMRSDDEVAAGLGITLPIDLEDILEYAFGPDGFATQNGARHWSLPLSITGDYDPVYSNLGFNLLGLVIEEQAQAFAPAFKPGPYGLRTWMQDHVFGPVGMCQTAYGTSRASMRLDREWPYFARDWSGRDDSYYGGSGARLPRVYGGGRRIELARGSSALVSTVLDLARFLEALRIGGSAASTSLGLSDATIEEMFTHRHSPSTFTYGWRNDDAYRDMREVSTFTPMGVSTAQTTGTGIYRGTNTAGGSIYPTWHGGSMNGTHSVIYRFNNPGGGSSKPEWSDAGFAVVFNRDADPAVTSPSIKDRIRNALAGEPKPTATISNTPSEQIHENTWALDPPLVTDWGGSNDLFRCALSC